MFPVVVRLLSGLCTLLLVLPLISVAAQDYYPPRAEWERKAPEDVGVDKDKLVLAVELAQSRAVVEPTDLAQVITDSFSPREPDFKILGPTKERVGSAGLVIRRGYIIAEWGDIERVDMTFSAVKSYLSTMMALALRDGLVNDLNAPVANWVRDGKFASEHNKKITWHHLMNQTSDWQGTLWGVPDWADRPQGDDRSQWPNRQLHEPGSFFKYNDVRINLAAYSLLQVWRRPLPEILKREIMDPIGASTTWRWHGYENSWVTLDGQKMQSVSGGGHFGGGLFISALDHARMGLLFLRNGRWQQRQIVPADWIRAMRQPTPAQPDYGYMWWLNTNRERIPAAPEGVFWAAGFGGNYIYVDQDNDLLIVLRWVPALAEVVEAVQSAITD
jgi:CubicO group peptidase (beta-lactamase class C family)